MLLSPVLACKTEPWEGQDRDFENTEGNFGNNWSTLTARNWC